MGPLYASLTARLMNINGISQVQNNFLNGGYYMTFLYHDITTGNNGGFSASVDWDPVTGMGSFDNYSPSTTTTTTTTTTATTATTTSLYSIISTSIF